jgi:general secretion pathway protein D
MVRRIHATAQRRMISEAFSHKNMGQQNTDWGLDSMTNYQQRKRRVALNHTTRPMRHASRARMIPVCIGMGLVLSILASSRAIAQAPTTTTPAAVVPTDARAAATADLLRRAQAAIDAKDFREAVELYRRAKVNAQPLPTLQPNVQALRQKLTLLGFDAALLDLPPSAPPAAAAASLGTDAASPQPIAIPLGATSLPSADITTRKADVLRILSSGRAALERGDIATAQRLASEAEALAVPENAFTAGEPRVWQLTLDADSAARRAGVTKSAGQATNAQPNMVQQASGVMPAGNTTSQDGGVVNSVYNAAADKTNVQPAQATTPVLGGSNGESLYREGLEALSSGNSARARELFVEAWKYEASMDIATRNQLKEKLTLMQRRLPAVEDAGAPAALTPIQKADLEAQAETRKIYREVTAELAAATELQKSSPMEALDRLQKLRLKVSQAKLDSAASSSMTTMIDRAISDQRAYVEANRGEIDLDLANAAVKAEMASEAVSKQRVDDEIASLVETFNDLMEERRYPEAEVVAKKVSELSPGSSIAKSMFHTSRMGTRLMINEDIASEKEDNVNKQFLEIDRASSPIDPSKEYQFADAREWGALTERRRGGRDEDSRLSSAEQDIKRKLSSPVDINYRNRALGEVLQDLSAVTNIPIVMDARAMAEMRVTSDSPVTLELSKAISLQSALNLILAEYELAYVIQNDVLNITSISAKRTMVYPKTYRVTDLVTPIPNFAASYEDGLAGALRAAHQMTSRQSDVQIMPVSMTDLANRGQASNAAQAMNPNMMGQYASMGSQGGFGLNTPPGGGRGGASLADFTSLIDLIQTTVVPDTWEALGGPSTMREYPQNLSLVISTTSEVHDQITELLESLRRLQNLQVTIEVRFITLSDSFFEQIGVDFDVQFDDNVNDVPDEDDGPSVTIGFDGVNGLPTSDFDVQLSNNFGVQPGFGSFDAGSGSRIGFAILSDIEAFFFLQAAQGDTRNNVLQAPKVTLFDGQLATISDVTQRPFVTSITPVVGDFAVAQQPVIVVLNEGTQLNVQAIVSDDKRFVRLTLVPFFSQIGDVDTFTYEGRRRRRTTSQEIDPTTGEPITDDEEEDIVEGTTVQLPQFAFTSVSTTVSVPDGGTILLGGIKRLSEGRTERGVPILSKIPYISRLFRNVAIGRDARSLMLMVTPRIIIQEEEEIAQTGFDPNR